MPYLKKILLFVVILFPLLFMGRIALANPTSEVPLISLDVKEIDIQDVLRLIAEKGNLNMVIEEEVRGKITLSLKQVRLRDALEAVLETKGLIYQEREGIIRIFKAEEKKLLPSEPETRIISLQYAPAEELRELLKHLLSPSGVMEVDKRTNALVITDLPDNIEQVGQIAKQLDIKAPQPEKKVFRLQYLKVGQVKEKLEELLGEEGKLSIDELTNSATIIAFPAQMEEIEEYLKEADARPKQVMIKAEFVEVSVTAMQELGIEWKWIGSYKGYPLEAMVNVPTPLPTAGIAFGEVGKGFSGAINVLLSQDKANLLSSPKVTTLDGREARIDVVEEYPYSIIEDEKKVWAGIKLVGTTLLVTPHVKEEKTIILDINPKVSEVIGPPPSPDAPPIIGTRETRTQIIVNSGETIVIGGLLKENEKKTKHGVPILSSIPVVDLLFTYRKTEREETDLLVFITPYILPEEIVEKEVITQLKPGKAKIEEIYQKGETYQKNKEYEKAKECFWEVIEQSQNYAYLSDYLEGAGKKIVKIEKIEERVEELSGEGKALYEKGRYLQAAQRFKAALRLNPHHQQSPEYITKIGKIEKETKKRAKTLSVLVVGIILAFALSK